MPDGSTTPPDPTQSDVTRQYAAKAPRAKAGANANTPDPSKPADARTQDPLKDVIERLDGARSYLSVRNPRLADTIGHLAGAVQHAGPAARSRVSHKGRLRAPGRREVPPSRGPRPAASGGTDTPRGDHPGSEERTDARALAVHSDDRRQKAGYRHPVQSVQDRTRSRTKTRAAIRSEIDVLENRMRLAARTTVRLAAPAGGRPRRHGADAKANGSARSGTICSRVGPGS